MRIWQEAWRGPYVLLPLLQPGAAVVVAGVPLGPGDWIDPDVLLGGGQPHAFLSVRDGTMPGGADLNVVPVARRRMAMRVRDLLMRDPDGERITYLPQAAPVARRRDGTLLAGAQLAEGYEPWRVGPQWVAKPQYRRLLPAVPSDAGNALQAWNVLRGADGERDERAPGEPAPCPARRALPLPERG